MKINKPLLFKTLKNTSLAVVYIFAVSQIMENGEKLFGNVDNSNLGPFVLLLLFSLSAAIVGGLIFGQSIYLFFDDKKKESVTAAFYSIGWLALITILGLISLAIIK